MLELYTTSKRAINPTILTIESSYLFFDKFKSPVRAKSKKPKRSKNKGDAFSY